MDCTDARLCLCQVCMIGGQMSVKKIIKNNNETKICKCCGRELPLNEFNFMYGKNYTNTCKECVSKKQQDSRKKANYEKGLQQYLVDDSMHIQRQYKKINKDRILRKKISGINFCAKNEKFVRLMYYKDAWISNYGRCIVFEDGEYKLLRGSIDKWTGDIVYTLRKERYIKYTQTYAYKKKKVKASFLVIETFVVNYDMTNNIRIWHLKNDTKDLYYKHLYPVTENQYERLTELQEKSEEPLSEDVIMDVINAVEYKQEGWNPIHYKRGMCGVGYSGMTVGTEGYYEKSYIKWRDMMQRCYDKNVHKKYKPEYADKCVCEEWQNYANFKLWFDEHYVLCKSNQIDLDKDLLVQGNKIYSPETCVFLVHYQNTLFEGRKGDCIYQNENGQYLINNKKSEIFESYEDAFNIVIERRKKKILDIAEKCKGSIPMCAYEAMQKWDVRLAMCS